MSDAIWLVLYIAAAWRLTYAAVNERGPANVFAKMRAWVFMRWPFESDTDAAMFLSPSDALAAGKFTSWQRAGVTCMSCVGAWVGLVAAVSFALRASAIGAALDLIALWGAVASGVIVLEILVQRLRQWSAN